MGAMTSQITSLTIVSSTVYSGSDQRKQQSSTSVAFVRGIHRWPVNSPHKGPVTRKKVPFDDVIMLTYIEITRAEVRVMAAMVTWFNYVLSVLDCIMISLRRAKSINCVPQIIISFSFTYFRPCPPMCTIFPCQSSGVYRSTMYAVCATELLCGMRKWLWDNRRCCLPTWVNTSYLPGIDVRAFWSIFASSIISRQ